MNTCSVCCGRPLASGRICICEGKGTEQAECEGLRKRLVELEVALGYFVNLPPQTSRAYAEVCEMVEKAGYVRKETIVNYLNSVKDLYSDKLSSVGIDDFGDLCDEVYVIRELMRKLWSL